MISSERIAFKLSSFPSEYMQDFDEFWKQKKATRTEHIRHITLRGDHNNNKMERMNGEVRDREKTMRGLKRADTPILQGYSYFIIISESMKD